MPAAQPARAIGAYVTSLTRKRPTAAAAGSERREQRTRLGPLHREHRPLGGDVVDGALAAPMRLRRLAQRGDERRGVRRVRHHQEVAGRDPPHDEVVDDVRVVGIEEVRVLRTPGLDAVEVVGERPLQRGERARAVDPQRSEVRHVEHHRALPTRAVLLEHTAVLDRHLPAAELRHARAQRAVLGVERAVTQCHLRQTRRPDAPSRRSRRGAGGARSSGCGSVPEEAVGDELRRRLEPVLHEQVQVVALVEHAHVHLGIELLHAARLAVLLGDELLVQRGDLDVEVVRGEVEVGRERLLRVAVTVGLEHERARLVLPLDGVEVEELRELPFGVVRETHEFVRQLRDGQPPVPVAESSPMRASSSCTT